MDKTELANKVEDLVRGLADQQAMSDHWWQKELAEVLSAILDSPSEADSEAVSLLRAWVAGCGDERYSTKEQVKELIDRSGSFLASPSAPLQQEEKP